MLVLLSVVNEGLAAGFVGVWDLNRLREVLGIPAEVMPLGMIPIGHPASDKPSPSLKRGHRPKDQVVHRERWKFPTFTTAPHWMILLSPKPGGTRWNYSWVT